MIWTDSYTEHENGREMKEFMDKMLMYAAVIQEFVSLLQIRYCSM
jgi:hypothetical protein